MIKRLSELKVGEYATIQLVFGRGRMRTRMFDMGITPSAKIFFRKTAPMGDPMQISIRGYELTLRKCEAYHILVETDDDVDINSEENKKKLEEFKKNNDECSRHYHFRHKGNENECMCDKKDHHNRRREGDKI